MSSARSIVKSFVERTPASVGKLFVRIPFSIRLGSEYSAAQQSLNAFDSLQVDAKKNAIFERVRSGVVRALEENAFYREFYSRNGYQIDELQSFDDIKRIPIVQKEDLRGFELEQRSKPAPGRLLVNTGGTSGQPLEFYLDRHAFAREWAHMHRIWASVGYHPRDLKLTFRGKNLGRRVVRYNPVHNEYLVSAYHSQAEVREAIAGLVRRHRIRYLHGYPSAIYEFAQGCEQTDPELVGRLNKSLRGILYGSEFPAPVYRDAVESVFPVASVSWYGHSEMAILAYERDEPYRYVPMHTYGYVEAVPDEAGRYRLIGTSYDNDVSPFIRYDTGDFVTPEYRDGLLESFRVSEGRSGEFIVDRNGHRISLTALVFGRHHEIFRIAQHLQIRQVKPGEATVMVVTAKDQKLEPSWPRLFDTSNVNIDFDFELIDSPIRTASGKLPLLVRS